ncbi:DNA-binding CsgD family transcriptional regulator [Nocardia sp. GAS34]|uniref:helix-turn-helix transcriptional regulator n=1 Tax=unclassified Nocardia TaxID=2637762 RepID=UPI003D1F3F3E
MAGAVVAMALEIAHLAGGTTTLRAKLGIDTQASGPLLDESEKAIAAAHRVLGPDAYAAAAAWGMRLRPERNEVLRLALGTLTTETSADKALESHWYDLSHTEQQVAILAAAGWITAAIAGRRGKSPRTVDAQISAIFRKLDITSRGHHRAHTRGIRRPGPARSHPATALTGRDGRCSMRSRSRPCSAQARGAAGKALGSVTRPQVRIKYR